MTAGTEIRWIAIKPIRYYVESKHIVKLPEFFTKLHVRVTRSGFQIANKVSITER